MIACSTRTDRRVYIMKAALMMNTNFARFFISINFYETVYVTMIDSSCGIFNNLILRIFLYIYITHELQFLQSSQYSKEDCLEES